MDTRLISEGLGIQKRKRMLIFNCTEAASKFFSRVHKGKKITPVDNNPPSKAIEDDEASNSVE